MALTKTEILPKLKNPEEFQIFLDSHVLPKCEEGTLPLKSETLGRLRRELFWTIGENRMHGVMARFGVSCGQSDVRQDFSQDGIIRGLGTILRIGGRLDKNDYRIDISNSCEAREFNRFFSTPASQSQCWLLAGYLTGLVSELMSKSIFFIETHCVSKNDAQCRFVGRPRTEWEPHYQPQLKPFEEDNIDQELSAMGDQLKLTKDRYQNLFEQSTVPVLIVHPESGAYLETNLAAQKLTGFSRQELLQKTVFDIREKQEHKHEQENFNKLRSEEFIHNQKATLVRKDGNVCLVEMSSKIIQYGGQKVIQTTLRDITDLKISEQKEQDLQQQLARSERLSSVGRLAAGVAHELKNPLGAIRNAVYYIRTALENNPILDTDPHLKEILKLAETEVDSSVTIIGELLDFSRVIQLATRKTNINELLERLPHIVEIPNNIKIQFDLDPNLLEPLVDPDRLNQVLYNITNNAIQAMPTGGTLKIRTRNEVETLEDGKSQQLVIIQIEDTGQGIAPWHLGKIFEPLFTTKARGTGLGLAISHNIIENHGGTIHVTSQISKGTTFTIELPLGSPPSKEDNNGFKKEDSSG